MPKKKSNLYNVKRGNERKSEFYQKRYKILFLISLFNFLAFVFCPSLFILIVGEIVLKYEFYALLICIGILPLGHIIYLTSLIKKFDNNILDNYELLKRNYVISAVMNITLLALFYSIFILPVTCEPLVHWRAEKNRSELASIADNLVGNAMTDSEKSLLILNWFTKSSGNMNNIYGLKNTTLMKFYPLYIFSEKPYICIRIREHQDPLWVLTSRCGACGEYSLLFREMASTANLTARSVHDSGENHCWDEVLIGKNWIVVDPSNNLFNISPSYFEEKYCKNISHVFAEYPNGTQEDITYKYTNLTDICVLIFDTEGKLLENVTIDVYSNNKDDISRFTKLSERTNKTGQSDMRIGGGKYTFKFKKEGYELHEFTRYFGENRKYYPKIMLNSTKRKSFLGD